MKSKKQMADALVLDKLRKIILGGITDESRNFNSTGN